jgi:hypothetical protein
MSTALTPHQYKMMATPRLGTSSRRRRFSRCLASPLSKSYSSSKPNYKPCSKRETKLPPPTLQVSKQCKHLPTQRRSGSSSPFCRQRFRACSLSKVWSPTQTIYLRHTKMWQTMPQLHRPRQCRYLQLLPSSHKKQQTLNPHYPKVFKLHLG